MNLSEALELELDLTESESIALGIEGSQFAGILPTWVSESDAYTYLDSTDGQVQAVRKEAEASASKLTDDMLKNLADFFNEWRTFYQKQRNESHWLDAASVMNQTDDYVTRLKGFQDLIRKQGVTPLGPGVVQSGDSSSNSAQALQSGLKTAAIAGGAALGLILAIKLTR